MIIFKTGASLAKIIAAERFAKRSIGFVPTMGALHNGHISLIEAATKENNTVVCSIFINPTQFNNTSDYHLYPVTIEKDIEKLEVAGCTILFLPSNDEVYPTTYTSKSYNIGFLETVLEGVHRPGHFQGVCQVVDILLNIVRPHKLYLGQKDFQQCMVINKLLDITGQKENIQLRIMPTLREKNGLAMSSRNLRLTENQREQAIEIYKALQFMKDNIGSEKLTVLKQKAAKMLEQQGFKIDYVEIANAHDLSIAENADKKIVGLIAATLGEVRLIDNLLLN
jgi:pantoate--beta-alanine ligase